MIDAGILDPGMGMMGTEKFRFPGHKSDMNSKSREFAFQLAMQFQGEVKFEGKEEGKFVSVFQFLSEQSEFSKA